MDTTYELTDEALSRLTTIPTGRMPMNLIGEGGANILFKGDLSSQKSKEIVNFWLRTFAAISTPAAIC